MKSPFKFLDAFVKEDKDIFFGRERETDELYNKIYRSNLLLVYGASGTGKTSVIQCGLGNLIQSSDWLPMIIRKEHNIMQATQHCVQSLVVTPIEITDTITKESLIEQLDSLYLDYFKPLYLIYDQFEELFISGNPKEIEDFFHFLKHLMSADIQAKVIIVIREEYLAYLTNWEHIIPDLFSNRARIETLSSLKTKEIITNSCSVYGIGLENEHTVENIYQKLLNKDGIVELPHLQVYLDRLYKEAYNKETNKCAFTNAIVESTGKLDDVLATFLNEQVKELPDTQLGWKILKQFITDKGTKKSISQSVWQSLLKNKQWNNTNANQILQQLIEHRVIRYSDKENTMELSHDSLAMRVFENLSAEEKKLIDVKNFLHTAYGNYKINGSYLTAKDVAYIEPFLPKLKEEKPILDFLQASKKKIRKERQLKAGTVVAIMAILAFVAVFSFLQQQKAVKAEQKALIEKEKVVKALQKAEEMQRKVETAMFDKAVKERNKKWKGYVNMSYYNSRVLKSEGKIILVEIDSLDLSNNELLRIPKEVLECPNLRHINLLGNENINWKQTEKVLEKLPQQVGLYVLIDNLDSINSKYHSQVTGVYSSSSKLTTIPLNILKQKQLEYIDISSNYLNILPKEIGSLINLKVLNLLWCSLQSLPKEIGNLTNLTHLDLNGNQLQSLPKEIGNLTNLTHLDLNDNPLQSLPKEIENFTNLINLNLFHSKAADMLFEEKKYKQALSFYQKVINADSTSYIAWDNAGLCYQLLGNTNKAIEYYKKALSLKPNNVWTLNQLSQVYSLNKDYSTAVKYTQKAIDINPQYYSSYFALSFYSLFINKPKQAISSALKTLELNSEAVNVETNLALGYLLDNQWNKAKAIYLKWKDKKFPDDERFCQEVFLQDIKELEEAGVTHPDFEKAKQLLK